MSSFYLDSRFPDGFQWQDYDDLEGYKIGGTLGYWYEDDFREADLNAEFVRNDEVNFRKLVFGRVDMVAAGDRVGWHVLHQNFPEIANKVSVAEKPLDQSRLHLMVSRDYPQSEQLLERFNRHLQQFKKSSAFKRLKSQYDAFSRSNARPLRASLNRHQDCHLMTIFMAPNAMDGEFHTLQTENNCRF